jgi:hypothetical protein
MTQENIEAAERTEDELFEEALRAEMSGKEQDEQDAEAPGETSTDDTESEAPSNTANESEPEEPAVDYQAMLNSALADIDKLKKALDTTNGTYGQKLAQMNTIVSELTRKLDNQGGSKVLVPKINLGKLKEAEYGELADLLQNVFDESFKEFNEVPQQPAFDPTEYVQKFDARIAYVNDRITKREQEIELRMLKREHPDYADIAGYNTNELGMVVWNNLDFGNWAATSLDVEQQKQLMTSNDAGYLSSVISSYKDARKQTQPVEPVETKQQGNKEAILANAVRAKKGAAPTVGETKTDEQLFREALAKELRSY